MNESTLASLADAPTSRGEASLKGSGAPPGCAASAPDMVDFRVPFEKFRLDNGLTVIVHEKRSAPRVSVNVRYKIGAKDEPPGKTGFAHLFEHLMFGGSAHLPGSYINRLNDAGASGLNGTTNHDRTNYYETVPSSGLDFALFAESDRMGHFYETINQDVLEAQRGVVQNEKRQTEGGPYGLVGERILTGTYPVGHPYAHTVIGSMEDIDAATLEDVRAWFKRYYAPSNAILTLAGDIDVATAKEKVQRYFGHIPPGPPLRRQQRWIPKMVGTRREVLEDRVPQAVLHMVWNIPEYGDPDVTELEVLGFVLTSGMSARLRRRLVLEEKIATGVSAGASGRTMCGQFSIVAHAAPNVRLERLEQSISEELERLLQEGPTAAEVERARTRQLAGFLRSLESTSGIAGMLAANEDRLGAPDAYLSDIARLRASTPDSVRGAALRWLSDGVYILHVLPFPTVRARGAGIDRAHIPTVGEPSGIRFPTLARETLSNGLRIVLAERHELPLVRGAMLFDSGLTAEPRGATGVGGLMMGLLLFGAGERDHLQFTEAKLDIGAEFGVRIGLESAAVSVSALKSRLEESLRLYADLILRPRFDERHFQRERAHALQGLSHEIASAGGARSRVLPGLLLPPGHPYARPMSGSGLPEHLQKLTRDELVRFHHRVFRPEGATLVIVGDTTMAEIRPLLERCFAGWGPSAASKASAVAPVVVPAVSAPMRPSVYLIDRPDSTQALVAAATVIAPVAMEDSFPRRYLNNVLGSGFSSRLNMNLREDKHWAYGASTEWHRPKGPQIYLAGAPVQSDKTAEAMTEIRRELADIVTSRPVTAEELARVRRFDLLGLSGQVATAGAISGAIETMVTQGLSEDYWNAYDSRARGVTLEQVHAAALEMIHPGCLTWVVVGDLERIEPAVRSVDFGPVKLIEAHGEDLYRASM